MQVKIATQDFQDPATRACVEAAIARTIQESFASQAWPMRHVTKDEIKRRFNLLFEGYRVLRNEEKWSTQRAIDHFPKILRAALDLDPGAMVIRRRNFWYGGR